jgi:PAS domain S-box-containing protein
VWPAAGLGLAALVLLGRGLWPAIFLGRLLAAWTVGSDQPLWADVTFATVNSASTVVAATMLSRDGRIDPRLSTLPDVLWLLAACLFLSVATATVGTAILFLSADVTAGSILTVFQSWVFGTFTGAAMIGSMVLSWVTLRGRDLAGARLIHFVLCIATVAIGSASIFMGEGVIPLRTWHVFPLLVWAAVAFQTRGASVALVITSIVAIGGVNLELGPFIHLSATLSEQLSSVPQFLGFTAATMLMLAGAADERRHKEALQAEVSSRAAAETRVRGIINSAVDAIAVIDDAGNILDFNPAAERTFGYSAAEATGKNVSMLMPEEHARAHNDYMNAYKATGVAQIIGIGREVEGRRKDGSIFPLDLSISQWTDPAGKRFFTGIMRDITERHTAHERERLLAREVDHRAKNLLAVAQSIVQLSRADTPDELRERISGRVRALGRAHTLLAASRWEGADLRTLLCDELTPFTGLRGDRIEVNGPKVTLNPAAAQALGMVFHELATNAAKYGAFSVLQGKVRVRWTSAGRDGAASLTFRWEESGGPVVAEPRRKGFGSTVLEASIEKQLKGTVFLHWKQHGLICDVTIPGICSTIGAVADAQSEQLSPPEALPMPKLHGSRVLVLEDESLLAIEIQQTLQSAGLEVLGPASRIQEASDLLQAEAVDVALLDINVAGEMSFPVAESLVARCVPFAFVTGYTGKHTLPEHLQDRPILAKPFTSAGLITMIDRLLANGSGSPHNVAAVP